MKKIKCKGCGIRFEPRVINQIFHSIDCRNKYYVKTRDKYRKREKCILCDAQLTGCKSKFCCEEHANYVKNQNRVRARKKEAADIASLPIKLKRCRYTNDEIKKIKTMYNRDIKVSIIAKKLHRSLYGVESKIKELINNGELFSRHRAMVVARKLKEENVRQREET